MGHDRHEEQTPLGGAWHLMETILLAMSVTGLWYYVYYLLAPWIWSQNIPFKPEDITPWILDWTSEHDGVEIYALYILVFVNSASACVISGFVGKLGVSGMKRAMLLCAVGTLVYCATIGFTPPMTTLPDIPLSDAISQSLVIMLVMFPLIALLSYLQRHHSRLALTGAALALLPACFLAAANFGWNDYTYIFAPAQRLLDGAAPSQIYFQYDLLPSLLAAAWMKLGLDLNYFRTLGQAAYFLTILGIFIFSGKLFLKKELAVFLLAALILGRMYASPLDTTLSFQVTPLRLDLWLPLMLVIYRWGPYHWLAGLACGLLLLLLKNFGIIYSAAYIQLLLTLWAIDHFGGETRAPFVSSLAAHGKRCAVPVVIIAVGAFASYFLFKNDEYGNYASYYQKIGIGFLQIAQDSFYWYVPALFSIAAILLLRLRTRVSPTYLTTGFLLIYCAIGNSIYFFGRSHEHNILNIAIVLLFLFFFVLDLIAHVLAGAENRPSPPSFLQKHAVAGIAVALIIMLIVSYSENITHKGYIQFLNVKNAKITYDSALILPESFPRYMAKIREVTGNSSKVFFVDKEDFVFYHYGGYAPVGYCNPLKTWIFTKDLTRYMQKLLDNGYYLVCSPDLTWLLNGLTYNSRTVVGETVVVAKLVPRL
jgi:hypothetical protein